MKKIDLFTFFIVTIIYVFLLIPAFLGAWAVDEGTAGDGSLSIILSKLFYVLRFPTHTLFWSISSSNATLYFTGLILNCAFYGLIIERFFSTIKSKRSVQIE